MNLKLWLKSLDSEQLEILKKDLYEFSSQKFKAKYEYISKKNYETLKKKFNIVPLQHTYEWVTNGELDLYVADDNIPAGFVKGRINTINVSHNYHWITNGEESKFIKRTETIPEGYWEGNSNTTTSQCSLYNDGVTQKYFHKDETIPESYKRGSIDTTKYKIAAQKRKKQTYTNGLENIRLTSEEKVPDGFILGNKNTKIGIVQRDRYFEALGYVPIKSLSTKQLSAYQYYRDILKYEFDKYEKKDVYTYINKNHIPMLDEYAKQNHSKGTSGKEQQLYEYLKSIYSGDIQRNARSVIRDSEDNYYELDFYIAEYHIAIEFNGTFWHSTENKDKNYHYNKSRLCEQYGIRLIHIYEYEWDDVVLRNKIYQLLNIAFNKVSTRIYARNCEIRKITNAEAKVLNNQVHLQGHRNAQVTYGLYHNGELVQLMSFSKTKYNRNLKGENAWEIIRGCPGSNNIVIGGVSKLFKHFTDEYKPDSIFSYCDFNKFDGKSYEQIGMKFIGYTGPDMKWVLRDGRVYNRQPSKHKELKENAAFQIYGAGSKKYLWKK